MATLNGPFPSARDGGNRGVPQDRLAPAQTSMRVIQGLDATLKSSNAAAQEVRNVAQQIALSSERSARMTASIERLIDQQAEILRQISAPMASASPQAVLQQVSASPGVPGASLVATSTADSGGSLLTPDRPGGDRLPETAGLPEPVSEEGLSNYERFQRGRQYSVRQLRQDVSRWAGTRISSAQFGPNIRPATNRRGWEVFDPQTGASLGSATHQQIRNHEIANRVRAIGGDMRTGNTARGIMNALPRGVIGPAAVVAGGLMVADQATQFVERQRDANAMYQRMLGGDNLEGLRERGSQALFSLSQRGVMGDRQSAELYQGVTSLGMTGRDRMDALDFATEQWRRFGTEVADSIALIRINAQNGVRSLIDVADALEGVTETARDAGVNADVARQNFTQAYGMAAPNLMGQGSAAVVAGAMTQAFTSLGPSFQDADFSGMFQSDVMYRVGMEAGLDPAMLMAETAGAVGGGRYTQMHQAALMREADRILGGRGRALISEYKQRKGISGPLTDEHARQLASEIFAMPGRPQPQVIVNSLRQYGLNLNPNDGLVFLLLALDGAWNPEGAIQDTMADLQSRSFTEAERSNFATEDDTAGVSSIGEVIEAIGGDPERHIAYWHEPVMGEDGLMRSEFRQMLNMPTSGLFGNTIDHARGLYARQIHEGDADWSPIIGRLLRESSDLSQRFRINVGTESDPRWREMTAYEAIQHHADQLARGDVLITEGRGEGMMLNDLLDRPVDETVDVDLHGRGEKAGREWDPGRGGAGGSGRIEVVPSPALRDLIEIRTYGAVFGGEPPSSQDGNYALPSGRG